MMVVMIVQIKTIKIVRIINKMEDLTCSDITDILDQYTIKYTSILNVKGDVNLGTYIIRINPIYNQDEETLIHEFRHIYDKMYLETESPEHIIEAESQQYLKDNPLCRSKLELYLESRTKRIEYEE